MFGLFKKNAPATPAAPSLRAEQLQARIKHRDFLKALQVAGVPPAQQPAHGPLCGELIVTYAFDLPDSVMMATPRLVAQAGVADAGLPHLARANLARAMPQPQFFAKDGCGLAVTGKGMEAALLLVDGVWDKMAPNFRGEIVAVVPRRDRILMCDSTNAAALASLRQQARAFFDEHHDQHRLSTQLMVRRDGGWALFDA